MDKVERDYRAEKIAKRLVREGTATVSVVQGGTLTPDGQFIRVNAVVFVPVISIQDGNFVDCGL